MASRPNTANRRSFKIVKPKKDPRRTTTTTRQHRFQSFTERVATLRIDPIRRRRINGGEEEDAKSDLTYFGQSLAEWRDKNLSQTFTGFAKEAAPQCDNLALVLHNEDTIMDLLADFIGKGDALAMEPLLHLLSQFAHDLDARFERHFSRAVTTVLNLAAVHSDLAVVEWSFNCLAWLFKYLSRLLAPDLRPLYHLLAPFLGKQSHRPFIVRFVAESFSFLLRRAATVYERDSVPLDDIVICILTDCSPGDPDLKESLHLQGVMTLFSESIKGLKTGVHGSGVHVVSSLLKASESFTADELTAVRTILDGVLTSLIHHCDAEGFVPILNSILIHVDYISEKRWSPESLSFAASLLFVVASVRKGTRISNWKRIVNTLIELLREFAGLSNIPQQNVTSALGALACVTAFASIDAVLLLHGTFKNLRTESPWQQHFLSFCDVTCRLNEERFQTFILPEFKSFVLDHSVEVSDQMLETLPRLVPSRENPILISVPTSITLIGSLENFADSMLSAAILPQILSNAFRKVSILQYLKLPPKQLQSLNVQLVRIIELGLAEGELPIHLRALALGPCLEYILYRNALPDTSVDRWWRGFCERSLSMVAVPTFWTNLLKFLQSYAISTFSEPHVNTLQNTLVQCLSLPSHIIRETALEILQFLYRAQCTDKRTNASKILSTAIAVESTPINIETSRSISLNIRRLAAEYTNVRDDEIMSRAMPSYCFGLLYLNLAQAWNDAIDALEIMCQSQSGEETTLSLAHTWLEGHFGREEPLITPDPPIDMNTDGFKLVSDFECSNLARCEAICRQVFGSSSEKDDHTSLHAFDFAPKQILTSDSRTQALRVLGKLPRVAEKRSRMLVPVLLRWVNDHSQEDRGDFLRWSRKDQKAMLGVFAQFHNPRVLYKSVEVYDAFLTLCSNGDAEIQRNALKAILAWKDPVILRYQENLTNLLDEARFREELSVFLHGESEEEGIRAEDEAAIMPVLLRLLYGRAIEGNKDGQAGRRKAIFVALSRFGDATLEQYVKISISSVAKPKDLDGESQADKVIEAPLRQQLGLLNMLHDMLSTLGAQLEPVAAKIMETILSHTLHASSQIEGSTPESQLSDASLLRSVRQAGMQSIVKLYATMTPSSVMPFQSAIYEKLVKPRLGEFAIENAHSISGMLRLIATWTLSNESAAIFLGPGSELLESLAALLAGKHTKVTVRQFILLEIMPNLLDSAMSESVMRPHVSTFVKGIGEVISLETDRDVLKACVASFTQLASRIIAQDEATSVIQICTNLLIKPAQLVSPGTKSGLLQTLLPLVRKFEVDDETHLYEALSGLFSRTKDNTGRILLGEVFSSLNRNDESLSQASKICTEMNAMGGNLDEPDNDRRELAFVQIYEASTELTLRQWTPIIHNCIHYMRDSEDRVNRTSASHAIQKFVQAASMQQSDQEPWVSFLEAVILPSIERACQDSSEIVRNEFIVLLGHIVNELPAWPRAATMQSLAVGGDDEASFFNNLLHIQHHRRLRALRRLAKHSHELTNVTITRVMCPLLEHFVFDPIEGDAGRTLADQAVVTLGGLAKALNWSSFRLTFKKYLGFLKSKEEMEKTVLRLLASMIDSDLKVGNVSVVAQEFLPPLMEYLHHKDESTVDRRMPVAVTIVKLLLLLPESETAARLPAALTDVCQVLRSKSQEARDQTRKALSTISNLVGSRYFPHILRELRGALKRGTQLHVLSFTVHSLLVTTDLAPEDLEYCLPDLVAVIMDDIFGLTGQEKDADDYHSAMKEVKSSKSFDTLELLSRVVSTKKLGELFRPIQALLSEKLNAKVVGKIDNVLVRIRKGLDENPASESRDMLTFCWEVVNIAQSSQVPVEQGPSNVDSRRTRYLVQGEGSKGHKKTPFNSYKFKLAAFSFNLVRKIVRRHDDLLTPQHMSGFLPIAGDAILMGQEEVKLSAIRFLSTLMKIPIPQLDVNAGLYVKEAVNLIAASSSTTTESSRAALELITSILREKRNALIKEKEISLVLTRLKPDIDEPDRQGVIYKFLRAALGRKVVVPELYEVMDEVGQTMVTNPDRSVRESARSAYLQFVTEFPQGKGRWEKQVSFLVGNLSYEHATGRQSVMEFLHHLLGKIDLEILQGICAKLFVALLPVLVSDSDPACRDMARALIGRIFENANEDTFSSFLSMMNVWLRREKKASTKSGALQCWAILVKARPTSAKQMEHFRNDLHEILEDCVEEEEQADTNLVLDALQSLEAIIGSGSPIAFHKSSSEVWHAIQRLSGTSVSSIHESVATLLGLLFTHLASTSSQTTSGLASLPLKGSGGVELGAEDMRRLCAWCLRSMRAITLATTENAIIQMSRNIVFLGRCFASNEMPWSNAGEDPASEEELENQNDDDDVEVESSTACAYLMRKITQIIQSDKFSVLARTAALQCQSTLINQLPLTSFNVQIVLRPLYALTDPTNPQPPGDLHKKLTSSAHELLDLLQHKMGSEAYVTALAITRAEAKARRDQRRQKRRIEAVSAPEKWAKEKKRHYEHKKLKQKQIAADARGRRRGW